MTQTAQNVAEVYGLSREEMDQFAVESHRKTVAGYEKGIYKDEIIAARGRRAGVRRPGQLAADEHGKKIMFDRDECMRPGTNMEALGAPAAGEAAS